MKKNVLVLLALMLAYSIANADTIPKYKLHYQVWINEYAHSISFGFNKKKLQYEVGGIWFPYIQPFKKTGYIGLKNEIKFFPEKLNNRWHPYLSGSLLSIYSSDSNHFSESYDIGNIIMCGFGIQVKIFDKWYFNIQINTDIMDIRYVKYQSSFRRIAGWDYGFNYPLYEGNFFSLVGITYTF